MKPAVLFCSLLASSCQTGVWWDSALWEPALSFHYLSNFGNACWSSQDEWGPAGYRHYLNHKSFDKSRGTCLHLDLCSAVLGQWALGCSCTESWFAMRSIRLHLIYSRTEFTIYHIVVSFPTDSRLSPAPPICYQSIGSPGIRTMTSLSAGSTVTACCYSSRYSDSGFARCEQSKSYPNSHRSWSWRRQPWSEEIGLRRWISKIDHFTPRSWTIQSAALVLVARIRCWTTRIQDLSGAIHVPWIEQQPAVATISHFPAVRQIHRIRRQNFMKIHWISDHAIC